MYRHIIASAVLAQVATATAVPCAITWNSAAAGVDSFCVNSVSQDGSGGSAIGTVATAASGGGTACPSGCAADSAGGTSATEVDAGDTCTEAAIACSDCVVNTWEEWTACALGSQTRDADATATGDNANVDPTGAGTTCANMTQTQNCAMPIVEGTVTFTGNFLPACTTEELAKAVADRDDTCDNLVTNLTTNLCAGIDAALGTTHDITCGTDFTLGTLTYTKDAATRLLEQSGRRLNTEAGSMTAAFSFYTTGAATGQDALADSIVTAMTATAFDEALIVAEIEKDTDSFGGTVAIADESTTAVKGQSPDANAGSLFAGRFGSQSVVLTVLLSAVGFLMA